MDRLLAKRQQLRDDIEDITKLRHIFFREKFYFFKFEKSTDPNLNAISIHAAFDLLQGFLQYQSDVEAKKTEDLQTNESAFKRIGGLLNKSKAMNSSGFVMQVQLRTTKLDENGNLVPGDLLRIQYQVVKIQKYTKPKTKTSEYVLYFSGASGENTQKVALQKLAREVRGTVVSLVSRHLLNERKEGTAMFVTFYKVCNEDCTSSDSLLRQLAAKLIYRSHCSVIGTAESGLHYDKRHHPYAAHANLRSMLSLPSL